MSFLRRMFSSDYRAAVAAEAAGNVDLAAERYALAGEHEGAVRMHLARAARAPTRQAEIAALRDALRWAGEDPELRKQARRRRSAARCGRTSKPRASRPSAIARRSARPPSCSSLGDDHAAAGEALEAIGDHQAAALAYSAGGLVEQMEHGAREGRRSATLRAREEADAFAELRDRRCASAAATTRAPSSCARSRAAEQAGEYRRMLDQLDTALLTAGKVELRGAASR